MSNRMIVGLWLILAGAGTWFFMSRNAELELLPTAIFATIVSMFVTGVVAHLWPGKAKKKSAA